MRHDNDSMVVPNLKYLGLSLKDIRELSIGPDQLMKLSETDIKKAESLLKKSFIEKEPEWRAQVNEII